MVEAVKEHHNPEALKGKPLTALVAMANIIVVSMGVGVGADGLATRLRGEDLKNFGLGQIEVELIMAELLQEMARAEELFNL